MCDPVKVTNTFNEYFYEEVQRLNRTEPVGTDCDVDGGALEESVNGRFYLEPTCEREILEIINRVCDKPSSEADGIPCEVLKVSAHIVAKPLSVIVNKSFEEGNSQT